MKRPERFRGRGKQYASGFLAALAVVLVMGAMVEAATTIYVDATFGNDLNSCTAPGLAACRTIQHAINIASSGATIMVAAGVYPEAAPGPLTINKTLTLSGAQSGIDARTRVGGESVVTDSQGTAVAADNVVIDGFTFQDSTSAYTGFGIWMGGQSGTELLNNIIQNNIIGVGLSNPPGGPQVLIRHNLIQYNNQPGSASGTGIYSDEFEALGAVRNVLIDENTFIGNTDAGIDISHTDTVKDFSDLEVSHNSFDMNGRALVLFDTSDTSIHDNTITNSTFVGSAAIRLFDNNRNVSIMNNDLAVGAGHAIRLSVLGLPGLGPSSGVVINENNIGVVGPASFVGDGLLVSSGGHVGTVNAECNWWGSPTGPTSASNPGGTGEEVVGDADFTPWLIAPVPGGACGITPGKVTGGGQIESDPIFSPLGDLLSLPALIPSLTDPTGQATFGFVAKCCPATGNLEYNDHSAGVRIKAQTVEALFIGSPGTACPATPGSRHAQFVGTAAVIRSTGTTTEPYRVDVDDCGEPGSSDTFGIKTTTYANGPSVLIGGNIQIHQ